MLRRMCCGKIHRATVTGCYVDYEGSIEIDEALIEAAGMMEGEMVLVANIDNGERFETYIIKGKKGSGSVALNGAAARLGKPGDQIIILSAAWMDESKARQLKPRFVMVDAKNKVIAIKGNGSHG